MQRWTTVFNGEPNQYTWYWKKCVYCDELYFDDIVNIAFLFSVFNCIKAVIVVKYM